MSPGDQLIGIFSGLLEQTLSLVISNVFTIMFQVFLNPLFEQLIAAFTPTAMS